MKSITIILILALLSVMCFGQDMPSFKNVADELGFPFSNINAWGQAWGDYDSDGDLDVLIARYRLPGPGIVNYSYVYRNDLTTFTDVSDLFGLSSDAEPTWQAIWVDYDNDGDQDLYYSSKPRMHLLRNDNGIFVEVAQQMGLVAQLPLAGEFYSSAWADYDLDGDLDVAITTLPHTNPRLYLFRNDGDQFVEVRDQVGLPASGYQHMFVITWVDYDHDGDPDFWTAGDDKGRLFRNDNGTFVEISETIGLTAGPTVSSFWFDYDNDLDFDVYTIGYSGADQYNQLFANESGTFEDVAPYVSADLFNTYRSLSVADFDNDGDQDIYMDISDPDVLSAFLLNIELEDGSYAFGDVAETIGLTEKTDSYSSATTDYNNDGWLDIFVVGVNDRHLMYKNQTTLQNNWVGFKLQGTNCNRDGIGAWVRIVTNGRSQIRTKFAGDGRVVQQLPWIHFGIGQATVVDSVIVEWPLGAKDIMTNVAINQYHTVVEGIGISDVQVAQTLPTQFRLEQNYPNPFNPVTRIDYVLPNGMDIYLGIYDVTGKEVITLERGYQTAGHHVVTWNGHDSEGNLAASGIYVYRMRAGNLVKSMKMVFAK